MNLEERIFPSKQIKSKGLNKEQILPTMVGGCLRKIEQSLHVEITSDKFKESKLPQHESSDMCFSGPLVLRTSSLVGGGDLEIPINLCAKYYSSFSIKEGR